MGLRAAGRRRRKSASPISGARSHQRRSAGNAAPASSSACSHSCRSRAVPVADVAQCVGAVFLALRFQSSEPQSAQGRDRRFRRFRSGARLHQACALHQRHQRDDGALAHLFARQDHRRCGDGLGVSADSVPGRHHRRRALLGRRLSRQSGDLPVLSRHQDRGCAGGADQPGGTPRNSDHGPRHREPHQRDQLQFLAAERISRDRIRRLG